MKPNIHPKYRPVLFHDTSVDQYYIIGSTADTEEEKEYKGKTYPTNHSTFLARHTLFTQVNSERANAPVESLSSTSVLSRGGHSLRVRS